MAAERLLPTICRQVISTVYLRTPRVPRLSSVVYGRLHHRISAPPMQIPLQRLPLSCTLLREPICSVTSLQSPRNCSRELLSKSVLVYINLTWNAHLKNARSNFRTNSRRASARTEAGMIDGEDETTPIPFPATRG